MVDYPRGQSASDPSMIVDRVTNTIFMLFNYMDLDSESQIYYLKYIKSQDNGKTWSYPVDITTQISKPEWHKDFKFITSGRGIQTGKGTLLHTLVNLDHGLHLFKSEDHGYSWQLIETPLIPQTNQKSLNSVMAVGWSTADLMAKDTGRSTPLQMRENLGFSTGLQPG